MYHVADFSSQVKLAVRKWSNRHYANVVAELNAIATGLGADPTQHSCGIEKPPAATQLAHSQTPFTNEILHIVDRGKAGNLTTTQMANAITSSLPADAPPVNTTAPAVTGTATVGSNLTCSTGTWTNSPKEYLFQWLRGSLQIAGAENPVYALIGTDSGNSVSCRVSAINDAGTASMISNAVAVA